MANNRTLTAANCILLIGAVGLFDVAQRMQGFATDDVTDMDEVQPGESVMGVDGRLSVGFTPFSTSQNVTLQADSESNDFFDTLLTAEETAREKYVLFGSLVIPATSKKYSMTRGFLMGAVKLPAVKKILQPRRFTIHWERVTPAPN